MKTNALKLLFTFIVGVSTYAQASFLSVGLDFDASRAQRLKITELQKFMGAVPKAPPRQAEDYRLELVDSKGNLIEERFFPVSASLEAPPPLPGEERTATSELTPFTFAVTIDDSPKAQVIRLRSPRNELLETYKIPQLRAALPTGEYATIVAPPPNAKALNIAFIGEGYSSFENFKTEMQKHADHLFTYEPYSARRHQIAIYAVANSQSLGCRYSGRLLTCNSALASKKVYASGAPSDKIVVFVNNSKYGGSGGDIAVSYNGESGSQVFVHEFGHSFGSLPDEYNANGSGVTDGKVHDYICFAGKPETSDWKNLVVAGDYRRGCKSPNWYRSSPGSLMLALNFHYFNTVSQRRLNDRLTHFAGALEDQESPKVEAPEIASDGSVSVKVTDNTGVARVELWVDHRLVQTVYEAPYRFAKPSSSGAIEIRAYDANENLGSSF